MALLEMKKQKILLIKLGAIGDVLRTTPLLYVLNHHDLTWVTSRESKDILENNGYAKVVICEEFDNNEIYDIAINLDEDERALFLISTINALKKLGYGLRPKEYIKDKKYYPLNFQSAYAYLLSVDDFLKFKQNTLTYQQIIFQMLNLECFGEPDYVFNPHLYTNQIEKRVGFNTMVGERWPTKSWNNWIQLEKKLTKEEFKVSYQKQHNTINEYVNWINTCEYVVTCDSLGMHIALALKKKVVALFTVTCINEVEMYGRGIKLGSKLKCSPCYKSKCEKHLQCANSIIVEEVFNSIKSLQRRVICMNNLNL